MSELDEIGKLQIRNREKLTEVKDGKYVCTHGVLPWKKDSSITALDIWSSFQTFFGAKRQITQISFRELDGTMKIHLNEHQ